jgi:hypothetical protein
MSDQKPLRKSLFSAKIKRLSKQKTLQKPKSLQKALKMEEMSVDHAQRHGSREEASNAYHKAIFAWTAPEYVQHSKTARWYVVAAVIMALSVGGALIVKNWTFALAMLVFAAVYYYLQKNHSPKRLPIVISEMGIKIGESIFPYAQIQAFWIHYHPPLVKTLNLRIHKQFLWDVVIQLEDQDPVLIRQFLCGQIPEWEGKKEQLSDIILRLLRL